MFAFCICFHLSVHDHLVQTGIFKGYCLEFSMGPKKTVPATKDDGNEGQADFDDMVSSTFTYQVLAGGAFGIAGGYMDSTYIEPFGVIFGSSLALLQLLDHQGVVSLCWMDDGGGGFLLSSIHCGLSRGCYAQCTVHVLIKDRYILLKF